MYRTYSKYDCVLIGDLQLQSVRKRGNVNRPEMWPPSRKYLQGHYEEQSSRLMSQHKMSAYQ